MLAKLFGDQIAILKSVRESYENKRWTVLREGCDDELDRKITAFKDETERLNKKVGDWLETLTTTSQTLIQLVK